MTALRDRPHLWLPLAWFVEAVLTLVDLARGPWSVVGFEEGRNARAALQLACGHGDRLLDLQYRDFCGGCTADAVLGAPLLQLLGDAVWVWKLVPAAFYLLLVGMVGTMVRLAHRERSSMGAVLAVTVLAASPWSLRELALTGWGNHAEVRGLVVAAAVFLLLRAERRWLLALYSLLAGIIAGLSIWYAHIATHALPALLMLAAFRRAAGVPFLVGVPLGLVPLGLFLSTRPTAMQGAEAMWTGLQVAPAMATLAYLFGPLAGAQWWPASSVWPGAVAVGLAVAGAGWGLVSGLRTPARSAAAFGLLAIIGFSISVWLRHDLWTDVPPDPGYAPFHLRYRAVLWPLVALGLGVWGARAPRRAVLMAAPLIIMGIGWRVAAWVDGPSPSLHDSVWSEPGRPDATVPEGQPPRRRPWGLDRAVDVSAAMGFAQGHTDQLDACHADHLGELGRRAGLQAMRGQSPALPAQPDAAVVSGIAWALTRQGRELNPRGLQHLPASWQRPVGVQVVRLVPPIEGTSQIPGADEGTCLGLADQAWRAATQEGRVPPQGTPDAPDACPSPRWETALGVVRMERTSCATTLEWPGCP